MVKIIVYPLVVLLVTILLVPASVLLPASASTSSSSSFDRTTVFVVDGTGVFVHDLNLKATESEDGEIDIVSDFEIEPEDAEGEGT
jgi:hypothetical protein